MEASLRKKTPFIIVAPWEEINLHSINTKKALVDSKLNSSLKMRSEKKGANTILTNS